MLESKFQSNFIKRVDVLYPGGMFLKVDRHYLQGIPDRLFLWQDNWAAFEFKRKRPTTNDFEPNQEYYLSLMHDMSFAACVYPENEEEVLSALQSAFSARRKTRVPQRK